MNPVYNRFLSRKESGARLCVGIDPVLDTMPSVYTKDARGMLEFSEDIIQQTESQALAYKINAAFFEVLGIEGLEALMAVRERVPAHIPFILDAKRGDIGHTSDRLAAYIFETLGADATTVHPYMGWDTVASFAKYEDRFSFVLGLTSNPSSADFQTQRLENGKRLAEQVVETVSAWNKESGNLGVVVGATQGEQIRDIRAASGADLLFLLPGVGAQGASFSDAFELGKNKDDLALVSISRGISRVPDAAGESRETVRTAIRKNVEAI